MHRIPLHLPERELVVAPVPARTPTSSLATTYMRLADCTSRNGYRALSVIDDRAIEPDEELLGLLGQVGATATWPRHDDWVPHLNQIGS